MTPLRLQMGIVPFWKMHNCMQVEWKGVKLEKLQRDLGFKEQDYLCWQIRSTGFQKVSGRDSLHEEVCTWAKSVNHHFEFNDTLS